MNRQNAPNPGGIRRVLYEAGFGPTGECYYCAGEARLGKYFCPGPGHDRKYESAFFSNQALWGMLADAAREHVANWRPPVDP